MNTPVFNSGSQPDVSSLLLSILDNKYDELSKSLNYFWKNSLVDHRVIIATALCQFAMRDFKGLCGLLNTLDASFSNNLLISALVDLLNGKIVESSSLQNIEEYRLFLDNAKNLEIDENQLGYKRSECPVLTDLNGDPFWIFADLLPYLWHVVQMPIKSIPLKMYAETDHYNWIKQRIKRGNIVLDVGANVGLFTNMLSRQVGTEGRVLAFEPNPTVFNDLVRVVKLNRLENVDLFPVAASNENGSATFNQILSGNVCREASGIVRGTESKDFPSKIISVPTITLDSIVEESKRTPDIIKIDVEGAEFLVLEGLRKTLKLHKPKMVIEFHPDLSGNFDHQAMGNFLKSFGYTFTIDQKNYFCE